MRRQASPLAGLLACLLASSVLAQTPGESSHEPQPRSQVVDLREAEAVPSRDHSGEAVASDLPSDGGSIPSLSNPDPLEGFLGYRYDASSIEWILGNQHQFGMFSFGSDHYTPPGVNHGIGVGLEFHFLNGPVNVDMPPRLYDFSLAYQRRDRIGEFGYDVAASVMASSDFEGSSRKGIRFPGHAVGFLSVDPSVELVFGVDYLDRGDVKLLPVAGLIALAGRDVRLEAVFPRPRAVFRLSDQHQLYIGGELGGGSWAIERMTKLSELATYHELRLCVGLQSVDEDRGRSAIEFGYLFDRRIEYSSGNGNSSLPDTVMIRLVRTY